MVALWDSRAWSGTSRFSARSSSPLEALRMPEIWFSRSCSLSAVVLECGEELLAADLGLLHDRRDALGVVSEPAVGPRLEASAEADDEQDQEADPDADPDQAPEQVLLAAPLGGRDLALRPLRAARALRLGGSPQLLFVVEKCHAGRIMTGTPKEALPVRGRWVGTWWEK